MVDRSSQINHYQVRDCRLTRILEARNSMPLIFWT